MSFLCLRPTLDMEENKSFIYFDTCLSSFLPLCWFVCHILVEINIKSDESRCICSQYNTKVASNLIWTYWWSTLNNVLYNTLKKKCWTVYLKLNLYNCSVGWFWFSCSSCGECNPSAGSGLFPVSRNPAVSIVWLFPHQVQPEADAFLQPDGGQRIHVR